MHRLQYNSRGGGADTTKKQDAQKTAYIYSLCSGNIIERKRRCDMATFVSKEHGRSLLGAKSPHDDFIRNLEGGGAKSPHAWKRFNIWIPWLLRPIIARAESIFYHPLFSPPPPHEVVHLLFCPPPWTDTKLRPWQGGEKGDGWILK